jgi:SAM-dependent methyltransferase
MDVRDKACNLCGSRDAQEIFQAHGYPILECRKCGLAFTGVITTLEEREEFYRNQYYARAAGYAEDIRQATVAGNPDYEDCVKWASKFVRRVPGSILDVGCGSGGLLAAFHRAGWTCCGIEPSKDLSSYARTMIGCEIYEGTFENTPLPPEAFDVITLSHVLEHSAAPRDFLCACYRALKIGGVLLVEVPDFGSRSARKEGAKWSSLYPDTHLYHFTEHTLTRLLEESCFHPVRIRRYGGLGVLSTQPPEVSRTDSASTETGKKTLAGDLIKRGIFEARHYIYRAPAMKNAVRYIYWHLLRMNEYLSIYALKRTPNNR